MLTIFLVLFSVMCNSHITESMSRVAFGNAILAPEQRIVQVKIADIPSTGPSLQLPKKIAAPPLPLFAIERPTSLQQLQVWLGILARHTSLEPHDTVLQEEDINKLDLVSESISGNNNCLVNQMPTCTLFGKTAAAEFLVQPATNGAHITETQKIIKALQDPTKIATLQSALSVLNEHSWAYTSLFQDQAPALVDSFKPLYFKHGFPNRSVPLLMLSRAWQSTSTKPSFFPARIIRNGVFSYGTTIAVSTLITTAMAIYMHKKHGVTLHNTPSTLKTMPSNIMRHVIGATKETATVQKEQCLLICDKIMHFLPNSRWYLGFVKKYLNSRPEAGTVLCSAGIGTIISALKEPSVYNSSDRTRDAAMLAHMKTKLTEMAHLLRALQQIDACLDAAPELRSVSAFSAIRELLHSNDAQIKKLIALLQTSTFSGGGFFALNSARVLAAYNLLNAHKNAFIAALHAAGKVDAFCAAAQLVNTGQYCFVKPLEHDTPYMNIRAFRNPLISWEKSVPNDAVFGENKQHHMIITGPNGSGKSIYAKGLALALVCAQAFGIAPAQEFTFTPYHKISSYLNVHEDAKNGISTFMAEQKRMNEIKAFVKKHGKNAKIFIVIDEPFKGTVEQSGGQLIYQSLQELNVPGVTLALATHFKKPAQLADENPAFANHYMQLEEVGATEFLRTFKIRQGKHPWWFTDDQKRELFIDWLYRTSSQHYL